MNSSLEIAASDALPVSASLCQSLPVSVQLLNEYEIFPSVNVELKSESSAFAMHI
jgi:hypothetical protein